MTSLEKAIEIVQQAIEEDTNHNYAEAYKLYQNSLDYFMLAMKYEKSERSKRLIRSKTEEYLNRAEKLRDYLASHEERAAVVQTPQHSHRTTLTTNMANLDKAIEISEQAIEEDTNHNYAEAYKLYQNSIDYYMLAMKYEKNERSKRLICSKTEEYLNRAEKLQAYLTSQEEERRRAAVTHRHHTTLMTNMANLDKAIEISEQAIKEDTNHNHGEAYKLYQNSLDYFMLAMKDEKNERSKQLIRSKTEEYLNRIVKLKDLLTSEEEKRDA